MNPAVDQYLLDGCGRCSLYKSPDCKVHLWTDELKELRSLALASGLSEEFKWSQPTYSFDGANVLMITALKKHAVLAFFKGVLLQDPLGKLVFAGPNSQSSKQLRYTNLNDVKKDKDLILHFIQEAIDIEKQGSKPLMNKVPEEIPIELQERFSFDPELEAAFDALSPGRKRSYLLHFNSAKQSKTVINRIEKSRAKILIGKGFNEY